MVLCLMMTRIREWPKLQMRKIKQKFMLTQVRDFPKKTASLSCVLLPFLESPGQSTLVGLKRPPSPPPRRVKWRGRNRL